MQLRDLGTGTGNAVSSPAAGPGEPGRQSLSDASASGHCSGVVIFRETVADYLILMKMYCVTIYCYFAGNFVAKFRLVSLETEYAMIHHNYTMLV